MADEGQGVRSTDRETQTISPQQRRQARRRGSRGATGPNSSASNRAGESVVEARDKTKPHWVIGEGEDGGNRCGRPLGGKRRTFTDCGYHSDHPANQIGRQRRQPVNLIVGPAVFDRDVLALDISGVFKSLAESAQPVRKPIRRLLSGDGGGSAARYRNDSTAVGSPSAHRSAASGLCRDSP